MQISSGLGKRLYRHGSLTPLGPMISTDASRTYSAGIVSPAGDAVDIFPPMVPPYSLSEGIPLERRHLPIWVRSP